MHGAVYKIQSSSSAHGAKGDFVRKVPGIRQNISQEDARQEMNFKPMFF